MKLVSRLESSSIVEYSRELRLFDVDIGEASPFLLLEFFLTRWRLCLRSFDLAATDARSGEVATRVAFGLCPAWSDAGVERTSWAPLASLSKSRKQDRSTCPHRQQFGNLSTSAGSKLMPATFQRPPWLTNFDQNPISMRTGSSTMTANTRFTRMWLDCEKFELHRSLNISFLPKNLEISTKNICSR